MAFLIQGKAFLCAKNKKVARIIYKNATGVAKNKIAKATTLRMGGGDLH